LRCLLGCSFHLYLQYVKNTFRRSAGLLQEFAYLFVILNGSSGIFMFIHSVILNQVVMMELKIRLGIEKKATMAVDWSGTGLSAVKVCNTVGPTWARG
jgi:hypothetical protein